MIYEHRTDEAADVTAVVLPARLVRFEVEAVGDVRVVAIERARPIDVSQAQLVEVGAPLTAPCGQEQSFPVGTSEQPTVHAVKRCPYRGTVIKKFTLLLGRGHAPIVTPVDVCRIVLEIQMGLVIHKAVVAKFTVGAVLRQCFVVAVAPLVGAPVVVVLGRRLAPGEVVAIFLGCVCAFQKPL